MELAEFYNGTNEDVRFNIDIYKLEYYRTLDILGRFIPSKKCVIYDVAGGTGHYFKYLTDRGHTVTMLDYIAGHIETAKRKYPNYSQSLSVGDARDLSRFKTGSADVVLNFGAMYHLFTESDRLKCINEAYRVLRKGGFLINTYCSRNAVILNEGLLAEMCLLPSYKQIAEEIIKTGIAPEHPFLKYFYFHSNTEIKDEFKKSNFKAYKKLLPVESIGTGAGNMFNKLDNKTARLKFLDFLRLCENDKEMIGYTVHIIGIAQKQN